MPLQSTQTSRPPLHPQVDPHPPPPTPPPPRGPPPPPAPPTPPLSAPASRTARTAASIVDPVARPSSTRTTVLPFKSGRALSPRYSFSLRSTSCNSFRATI